MANNPDQNDNDSDTPADDNPFEGFVEHKGNTPTSNEGEEEEVPADEDAPEDDDPEEDAEEEGDEEEADPDAEEEDDEEEDAEEDEDEEEGDEEEEPDKKKVSPKRRIAQLTARRKAAETRAERAEQRAADQDARIAELEKKLTPGKDDGRDDNTDNVKAEGAPDPDKYEYGQFDPKYLDDLADFRVEQKFAARDKEAEEAEAAATAEREVKEWGDKYATKVTAGKAAYKDFKKVVVDGADNDVYPLTQETALMIFDSDVGEHVAYHIAKRPKFAAKMAKMSVINQAKEFGRIEAKYASTPTPKTNKTPKARKPLSKPRGGGGAKKIDAGTSDFAAFEAKVKSDAASKHRK